MSLLVDLFGYLSIILHGLTIVAQSIMLGSVLFVVLLARPFARPLGDVGTGIVRGSLRFAAWGAAGLIACEGAAIALQTAILVDTVDLPVLDVLGANFAVAGLCKIAAAALILALALLSGARRLPTVPLPTWPLLVLVAAELAAATLTTHAAARLDDRGVLLAVEFLHQLGAAVWIGGLPCFLLALHRVTDGPGWAMVGTRYSRMSMAGVGCILLSGLVMSVFYVGSFEGLYGTAYGVMVGAKIAMFLMLLALGAGNFRLVERLRTAPGTPVNRLRRFAEVEIGIGITIFFAAASLTSVPPAVDLRQDRVTMAEILDRNAPAWPRLASPEHDALALPALQARLDAEAARTRSAGTEAFIPGGGELAPRNAADIAWSEYNHHWSGLFVLAIGALALLNQAGLRWARHWPLLFLALAAFLFVRSDPENWPLGHIGLLESLRDVEVLQHRVFVLLLILFGLFEWRVRTSARPHPRAALVFPLICAGGGALLLTHSHAIANVKEALLIELTHTPLALAAVVAGWSRWLELRLAPPGNRIAGWVWPVCLLIIGLTLIWYREA